MELTRRLMLWGTKDEVVLTLVTDKLRSYGISLTKDAARELAGYLDAAVNLSEGWHEGEVSGVKF